jgi:hypothetical protein
MVKTPEIILMGVARKRRKSWKIKKKERKIELELGFDLVTAQPNFYWAFEQLGPGSCWAQYPAIQGPSPIFRAHPNLRASSKIQGVRSDPSPKLNEKFLNSSLLN